MSYLQDIKKIIAAADMVTGGADVDDGIDPFAALCPGVFRFHEKPPAMEGNKPGKDGEGRKMS